MSVKSNYSKGIFFALSTALLWGFLPIVLKVSLSRLSPLDVSWFRFAFAFIVMLGYHLILKPTGLSIIKKPPLFLILASICLGLNYLGLISGVHHTTPAIAEVFIQSGAIFLAIVSFIFFGEKASPRQMFGILVVISGLGIFYWNQILVLADNIGQYQKGVFFTLFAGTMWTCFAIFQRKLVRKYDPMQLNLVIFGIPAIGFLPFVNFSMFAELSLGMWGVIIFLGANTLIAYGALAYALKFLDASKVSVIITLNPIITFSSLAILMAMEVAWVVEENFTLISILGAIMVVIGSVLTIMKARSKNN